MTLEDTIMNTMVYGTSGRRGGMLVGGARKSGSKTARKRGNPVYMDFVKQWHKAHPGHTWAQAMKMAKSDYHQSHGSALAAGAMAAGVRRRKMGSKSKKSGSKSKSKACKPRKAYHKKSGSKKGGSKRKSASKRKAPKRKSASKRRH